MGLGAPGTPGAYRDRYLYRVTINTNSWKVALGIILGPCGKVTYTYLYSPLSAPFRSYPPPSLSSSISFSLFSLSRLDRKRIIISNRSMIVCASLLLMLYVLTPPPPSPLFFLLSGERVIFFDSSCLLPRPLSPSFLFSSCILIFFFSTLYSFLLLAISLSRFRRASLLFLFRHDAFSSPRDTAPFVIQGSLIEAHPSV